jgi:hypothetical protein
MPVLSQKRRGERKNGKRTTADTVSLASLTFEEAIRAALSTGKAPPLPKRGSKAKPKGKK